MIGKRQRGSDDGFTLVETLAALTVFSVVTLGILPMLLAALKGGGLSRSYTVGKNVALEAMERARGLPYFVSYTSQQTKVDVLDLYFPNLVGNAALRQSYSGGTFTTVCDSTTAANPACPRALPEGHSVKFVAKFVNPDGTAPTIPSDYAWNATGNKDIPPSQLLEIAVTAEWTQAGRLRSFTLRSLIGDRKSGELKLRGHGSIDYALQVLTSFVPADPSVGNSELLAIGGSASSRIESKAVASADQVARAAQLRLTRTSTGSATAVELAAADGALSAHHAPPDEVPGGASAGPKVIVNGDLTPPLDVAGIDDTLTGDLEVKASNQLPLAKGSFSYQAGGSLLDFWVMNQADTTNTAALRLDPAQKVLSLRPSSLDGATLRGNTRAETTTIGAPDRKVETEAATAFKDLRLLPTVGFIDDTRFGGAVVQIESFSAQTVCTAARAGATPGVTSQWSALLRYWEDANPSDGLPVGSYRQVSLAGSPSGTTDPLQAVKASNPLVYDDPIPSNDVYLFREEDASGQVLRKGYLSDWKSVAKTSGATAEDGTTATAAIDTALRIDTAPTNPSLPESGLNVSIGKLSCEAVDLR